MSNKYDELLKFIPLLKDDNYGEWIVDHENDGTPEHPIHLPFVHYSKSIRELEETIYKFQKDNPDFELVKYNEILSNNGIRWGAKSMETADISDKNAQCIMALLIGVLRADRFSEGTLLSFLKSGAILRWLERLKEIAGEV